ncbi:MAG: hypothetical protein J6T80_05990 [Paludibacteraceae bacterium]|nr:hypothetical protein [Paludibacteraceae bacterium]
MKKLFLLISLFIVAQMSAVDYCATSAFGYGASATGGGNASPTLVKSESEFKSALKSGKVVLITQDITIDNQISTDASNMTIIALPGKRLISKNQTKEKSGILYLKGSNIILRDIIFEGPGAYDCDGKDLLTLDGAKNVWVDHCDFQDGMDGNFDIKGKADNISVTFCRFRYLKKPKPDGPGGADDHRFTNLIGSSVSDKPADGTYNITYGFCWWDEGCVERMTRCRNSLLHFINCYWNSSVSNYYVCPEYCSCYFEGCTFAGKANTNKKNWKEFKGTEGKNYCKFVNCSGNSLTNSGSVDAPSYSYDKLTAAEAKTVVTNSSCGAGATLTVTENAEVSSSCDNGGEGGNEGGGNEGGNEGGSGEQGGESVSGDCCVNLGLGDEPSVANGGIPANFSQLAITTLLTAEKGSKWEQGYLLWGTNSDYITFDFSAYSTVINSVEFDVTIPNWTSEKNTIAYHWDSAANTKYTIQSANTENVQLTAPANAKSFTLQRSASTGTRISQVCFRLDGSGSEDIESIQYSGVETQKIIREGQLLILRENKTYTIYGVRVD